jgi:hypothetical protein
MRFAVNSRCPGPLPQKSLPRVPSWVWKPCQAALVSMLVAAILICGQARGAGTGAGTGSQPLGSILGWGQYAVDRMPAPPGTLVFPGDVVTTEAGSGVEIQFATGSVARLEAASEVIVAARDLELRQGSLTLRTAGSDPPGLRVLGASVTIESGSPSSLCRLQVAGGAATVAVERGAVTIRGAGAPAVLAAGHAVRIGMAAQQPVTSQQSSTPAQAPSKPQTPTAPPSTPPSPAPPSAVASTGSEGPRMAGRVVAVYPDEVVRHPGDEIPTPLRMGEIVDIGDVMGTLGEGRTRVQLLDNTLVDVGVNTTLHLVTHDPAAHTTELRLQTGYLRAEIPPVDGGQPQFEVSSDLVNATAGATTFFFSVGPKETAVCNAASGPVTVRAAASAAGAAVKVAPDECSVTKPGETPGASHPDRQRMERAMSLASFEGAPGLPQLVHREEDKQVHAALYSGVAVLDLIAVIELPSIPKNLVPISYQPYATALGDAIINSETATELNHELCLAFLEFGVELGATISPSVPPRVCPNPFP